MCSRYHILVAAIALLQACRAGDRRDATSEEPSAATARDLPVTPSITTEYSTALLFLPLEPSPSRALVFAFANLATASATTHHYRGWTLSGSGWRDLLDIESRDISLREPWRLFPVEALRLSVTADGDPDVLIVGDEATAHTLELRDLFDRWEDRAGTQHEIRQATLAHRGARVSGLVVQHRFAVPEPRLPARFGPYERVILRSDDGALVVLFDTGEPDLYGDPYAWMYADGLTRRWTAVESRTVEVASSATLRRNVPVRFWFRIPEPDIKIELAAAERLFDELSTERGPRPYSGLYRVRGWIEFAGERRNVEGLLNRGET